MATEKDRLEGILEYLRSLDPVKQLGAIQSMLNAGTIPEYQANTFISWLKLEETHPVAVAQQQRAEYVGTQEREQLAKSAARAPSREPEERYPAAGGEYYPFIENLPTPAMKEYYRRNVPSELYSQLGDRPEKTGLSEAERALRVYRDKASRARGDISRLGSYPGRIQPPAGVTAQRQQAESRLGSARTKIKSQAQRVAEIKNAQHPFLAQLEAFPFAERYSALSARERGDYPSKFNPRTRVLGF